MLFLSLFLSFCLSLSPSLSPIPMVHFIHHQITPLVIEIEGCLSLSEESVFKANQNVCSNNLAFNVIVTNINNNQHWVELYMELVPLQECQYFTHEKRLSFPEWDLHISYTLKSLFLQPEETAFSDLHWFLKEWEIWFTYCIKQHLNNSQSGLYSIFSCC